MDNIIIKYKDILEIILDNKLEPIKTTCSLVLYSDTGSNRIVYDLGNKILKVARSEVASFYNLNEIKLWNFLKERSKILKFNRIFEYDENG